MDYSALISRGYEYIETDEVDKAVMLCLRIARNSKDYFNSALFLRELYPDTRQLQRAFIDETSSLKKEVQDEIWKRTREDWIQARTMRFSLGEDSDKNVLAVGIGEISLERDQIEKSISDMKLPKGMGEYDTAAFTDRYNQQKAMLRLRISALNTIWSRTKTRCLNYLIRMEKQFEAQNKAESFFIKVQNDVNNYFESKSDDVYTKLLKTGQLIDSENQEDQSLLLTQVRRAIKAVADYYYPPKDVQTLCSDGEMRKLGEDEYLNRLQEYIAKNLSSSSSNELLKAELDYLVTIVRRLNDVASKGVHGIPSTFEAKQGFLSLYFFLFNIISREQNA
jgi:hypothetical protein